MALTAYITATPLDSGLFKDIYSSIREFKSRFKERFELDHYMGGVVDDTDPTCEGYHKQLTMNGGEYNATNIPATIPACPTGGIVFFSIGGELCCYDGNTAKQITDDGQIASGLIYTSESTSPNSLLGFAENASIGVGYFSSYKNNYLYSTVDAETWALRLTIPGDYTTCKALKYLNDRFVAIFSGQHSGTYSCYVYYSTDGISWTQAYSYSNTTHKVLVSADYVNNVFVVTEYSNSIITSTDGVTWTERTCSALSGYGIVKIIYDGSHYILACPNRIYDPIQIMTSGDLTNNFATASFSDAKTAGTQTSKIEYNSSAIIVASWISGTEYKILYSTDGGANFSDTGIDGIYKIFVINNIFFAIGETIRYSTDGANWTTADVSKLNSTYAPSSSVIYTNYAYNQSENMILLSSGTKIICSYDNGLTWEYNDVWVSSNLVGVFKNGFITYYNYYIRIFTKYKTLE